MMATPKPAASTSAKILYRPVGIVSSLVAGIVAKSIVTKIWTKAVPGTDNDPPKPLESDYTMRTILAAALVEGAVYAVVKAATQRGGARAFERATGEWPGK